MIFLIHLIITLKWSSFDDLTEKSLWLGTYLIHWYWVLVRTLRIGYMRTGTYTTYTTYWVHCVLVLMQEFCIKVFEFFYTPLYKNYRPYLHWLLFYNFSHRKNISLNYTSQYFTSRELFCIVLHRNIRCYIYRLAF